ncbi:MAG TPA: hypothetical protein VE198_08800 [Actinoallomurus sp.]|nr:hypothetical protein [Actinoallomurus sp.]
MAYDRRGAARLVVGTAPKITVRFSSATETCMMAITCGNVAAAAGPWTTRRR